MDSSIKQSWQLVLLSIPSVLQAFYSVNEEHSNGTLDQIVRLIPWFVFTSCKDLLERRLYGLKSLDMTQTGGHNEILLGSLVLFVVENQLGYGKAYCAPRYLYNFLPEQTSGRLAALPG